MARTHHATRTFRLSCGCLRDYPGMATGRVHHVLCPVCCEAATTMYVYPNNVCGTEGRNPTNAHLMCTNEPGMDLCANGVHYDKTQFAEFRGLPSLKARRDGETRRAL